MYAATSPSRPAAAPGRMHGRAELGFVRTDGVDRLDRLYQSAPLRVLFPTPPHGEPPVAALVTTSGGLAGGDCLELAVTVGEDARAMVVASAAEKVYRSTGPDTRVEVVLGAEKGAWLEFLPQETILFDGARLRRQTRIEAASGASILAGEILVFGRTARGERMNRGLARDAWEIRRGGRLVWADALHMDGDIGALLSAPAGFDRAVACATLVLVSDGAGSHLSALRSVLSGFGGRAGATLVNGSLVARWLDEDALRLRNGFAEAWMTLRAQAGGLPARLPRLWHV